MSQSRLKMWKWYGKMFCNKRKEKSFTTGIIFIVLYPCQKFLLIWQLMYFHHTSNSYFFVKSRIPNVNSLSNHCNWFIEKIAMSNIIQFAGKKGVWLLMRHCTLSISNHLNVEIDGKFFPNQHYFWKLWYWVSQYYARHRIKLCVVGVRTLTLGVYCNIILELPNY